MYKINKDGSIKMEIIERVRSIKPDELEKLLELYQYLNPEDPPLEVDQSLEKH